MFHVFQKFASSCNDYIDDKSIDYDEHHNHLIASIDKCASSWLSALTLNIQKELANVIYIQI
jgi:hypothetical protein